jgi:hypothetical protein
MLIFIALFGSNTILAQDFPLVYENDFESPGSLFDFEFTDADAWRISNEAGNNYLDLFQQSNYEASVRSPFNIAMINQFQLGSFMLDVELQQTGREYGHRDMCLFFGMKDPTNFYYIHIASAFDDHAHSVFIVNDEARKSIATFRTEGIKWGQGKHSVRIERDITSGSILVYFDDMDNPIMKAEDMHFLSGYIGFGSFDDVGRIDNIKIHGEVIPNKNNFWKN